MRDQQSSRSTRLLEVGQAGMTSLLREPVKQAVREALAEERPLAETRAEHTRRSEEDEHSEHGEETETRLLRPAVLLPILGLAAAVAIVKRRRLLEFAADSGIVGQDNETDSPRGSNRAATADSDATDTKYSTSPDAYDGDTEGDGAIDRGDYNGDPDAEGLSTTE